MNEWFRLLFALQVLGMARAILLAIAVQGKSQEVDLWRKIYESEQFTVSRQQSMLFLLSIDTAMSTVATPNIHQFHLPGSTWTEGRNKLAREIFALEKNQTSALKYWLFADSDMSAVSCNMAKSKQFSSSSDIAAFCMDRHIQHYLLGKLHYASVFFLGALGSEQEMYHFDCGDAQFHAINRAAVPVLLPYVERLDLLSWQEAQAVLWRVAAGCLAGGGIGGGILSIKNEDKKHSKYPGGSFLSARSHVINELFGAKYSLSPHPIDNSTYNSVQGDCRNQPNQLAELARRSVEAPSLLLGHRASNQGNRMRGPSRRRLQESSASAAFDSNSSVASVDPAMNSNAWRHALVFRWCNHRLSSRFDQYMSGTPLEEIDGPRLQPGGQWTRSDAV